jgi:putative sigma-54 modulation protein
MTIRIRTVAATDPAAPTASILEEAERRLQFALGRFAGRIRRVDARLADVNGPRGGVDQVWQVIVRLTRRAPAVVIEESGTHPGATIGRAADRAAQAVSRTLARLRRSRGRGLRLLAPWI